MFEVFHQGLTIPTFVVALSIGPLYLTKSRPRCHNLHQVVSLFEAEDTEWLTIFFVRLQHIYTLHPLVRKFMVNDIPWNTFQLILMFLDNSADIHYLPCKCKNPICNTKITVHNNRFYHMK